MTRRIALLFAALALASCGHVERTVSEAQFGLVPPTLADDASSAIVVHSDLEGGHLPPRLGSIAPHGRIVLSFVACVRTSENYGEPKWSCRPDDAPPTPDEARLVDRLNACFAVERREASRDVLAAASADSRRPSAAIHGLHFVFLRTTQINRTKEVRALGCEGAGGHPCDPVGAESTGRTLEQVTRARDVWVIGQGAPADPYLHAWPFPPWRAPVSYATIETPALSFAPSTTLDEAEARQWLERLSTVDDTKEPRAIRLAILWNRAVLALKLGDRARGAQALAAAEKGIAPDAAREPIDRRIVEQGPVLHALVDGTLSLADPCRREIR